MKVGYGYNRSEADLKSAGAEKVYIDTKKTRDERARMFSGGMHIRKGDTLVLMSIRDLGGSPLADKQWRKRCEDMGISLEVVEKPAVSSGRPAHRPRKYQPNMRDREIWLNGLFSEVSRLNTIEEHNGFRVSKGVLNRRYGNPSNPLPI